MIEPNDLNDELQEPSDQPPQDETSPAPDDDAALQMPLPSVDEQVREAQDQTLRAQAELENFRKRMRRQMEEERRYATLPLIRDLLPAVDNLQRAIEAADASQDSGGLLEGVKLVQQQLLTVFEQHHCQEIQAAGHTFDPNFHEALAQQPSAEHPAGSVALVAQTGYRLHDRVVRPAQVIVSTGPPAAAEEPSA